MILNNYSSGELEILDQAGHALRLDREASNRLIMMARMHTVAEFVEKLPQLIHEEFLQKKLLELFEKGTKTQRWNLKEKFARLNTLTKGCVAPGTELLESIKIED